MLFIHDTEKENALQLSRFDVAHPLSSCSPHPITLEEQSWLTCEHYFNAQLVTRESHFQQVISAPSGKAAHDFVHPWYRKKVKDWKKKRRVLMSRALYTKAQMYAEVREALLATGDRLILETSLYDHFWGVGRDLRGENMFGRVWMDIRKKLREAL